MSVALHRPAPPDALGRGQRRSFGPTVRRLGLATFFVSIAVNAALGIYAVVTPDFGETQGKILATSLCVTGAVLLALACEPAWERKLLGPVPLAGAVLGTVGFTLAVIAIWAEPDSEDWGNVTVTVFTATLACVLASLLALARLAPRHRWVFVVALTFLGLAASMEGALPWLGDDPGEVYLRAMGVVFIALAAFVVTVPVLHWVDRGALTALEAATDTVRFCPYCGKPLVGEVGVSLSCGRCGKGFTVASPTST
jgi:hypothetical protein